MSSSDTKVLGVVLLIRHGDRAGKFQRSIAILTVAIALIFYEGFYQDPTTYTASDTILTPLGNVRNRILDML